MPAPDFQTVPHPDAASFLERAEPWLLDREAEHNLILSLSYARAEKGEAEPGCLFATVESAGEVAGCVVRTPPHKLLVSAMPVEAAPSVADVAASLYDSIPAVLGPKAVAERVAGAWIERRGGRWNPGMRQRIYRLDTVIPPTGVSGALRPATEEDLDLADRWAGGFADDVRQDFRLPRDAVARMIARGSVYFWEDARPVSMVAAQGVTPHGCRVGFVYTPPEHRGAGYASAGTAAVSQLMLDGGRDFCVLYTDLSNPTSNAIYRAIGYEPLADVCDVVVFAPDPV